MGSSGGRINKLGYTRYAKCCARTTRARANGSRAIQLVPNITRTTANGTSIFTTTTIVTSTATRHISDTSSERHVEHVTTTFGT
jgi:hypothetical protein